MGARGFLVIALVVLLLGGRSSGTRAVKRAPGFVRNVIDALVIVAAVRIGVSVAVLAFDSTLANIAFPVATGILTCVILLTMRLRERPAHP